MRRHHGGAKVLTEAAPAAGSPPATGDRHGIAAASVERHGVGPRRPDGPGRGRGQIQDRLVDYVGWMPWGWAADQGIVKKWADKYGIEIEVAQINDYVESINQYTAGGFDGCAMTNMDALTIPAAGGVDSTALIVGDFPTATTASSARPRSRRQSCRGRASTWSSSASPDYRRLGPVWRLAAMGNRRPRGCLVP